MGSWDANDLLTLLNTWSTGDVSLVKDRGNLEQCLSGIKAKGLIMPSKTDLYFPVRCFGKLPGMLLTQSGSRRTA